MPPDQFCVRLQWQGHQHQFLPDSPRAEPAFLIQSLLKGYFIAIAIAGFYQTSLRILFKQKRQPASYSSSGMLFRLFELLFFYIMFLLYHIMSSRGIVMFFLYQLVFIPLPSLSVPPFLARINSYFLSRTET
jgi:hypothetical protein